MTRKLITFLAMILFLSSQSNAQVDIDFLGQGTYQYTSIFEPADLEFYLFGDGYHSFEHDPRHQFQDNGETATAVMFHSFPYNDDEPDEIALNNVTNGVANAVNTPVSMLNKVELKTSWNLVNSKQNYFLLMFENTKPHIISGCVEFHYTKDFTDVIESKILDDYNNDWVDERTPGTSEYFGYSDKYSWTFDNMEPGEQRFVYIPADCLMQTGYTVRTMAIMKENCGVPVEITGKGDGSNDEITESDFFTLESFVSTNPHDPNCIIANAECLNQNNTQVVRYRVYFQNEGVTPATNVYLDFFLNAPINNIDLVKASDNCVLYWEPTAGQVPYTLVKIHFYEIFLQGTGQPNAPDYDKTVGWVDFDVCYDLESFDLIPLECASNSVDITFDNEAPITAYHDLCFQDHCSNDINLAVQDACDPNLNGNQYFVVDQFEFNTINQGSITSNNLEDKSYNHDESISSDDLTIYPNPVLNIINVEVPQQMVGNNIEVFNVNGQKVFVETANRNKMNLDITKLEKGVYYLTVRNESQVMTKTFMKL